MADAPTQFMGRAWRRHALDEAGRVADSRAYVFAALDAFRAVPGSSAATCSSQPVCATPTRDKAC